MYLSICKQHEFSNIAYLLETGDWYGQDGGTDVSVRAPHLLANYKVKDARMDKIALSKKKTITLKRTSTQRSDSSGSESSSPSDKRLRNTKHKDNEGEIQE